MDFRIELPEDVKYIISSIEKKGLQAYAVGGCVRDTLLGKNPDDWDITTSALPAQIKSFFKKTIDTGIAHGTVTVMLNGNGYEVTTYRIDGEYKDGRHPESVEFSVCLTDDLCRRDFTINAMAYNDTVGLVDEFEGIKDLENKVIRCVGDPIARFTEDALRMMRAIRFSAQLGFDIEPATYQAILTLAPNINKVSMERVCVEFRKTIMSDNPELCRLYAETGLFKDILPVLNNTLTGKYARRILLTTKYIKKTPALRFAAILSGCTPEEAEKTLRLLKMDNKTTDIVKKILQFHKEDISETEPAVREALHKYGKELMDYIFEFLLATVQAGEEITFISNPSKRKHVLTLKRLCRDILDRGDCFTIKDLDITGNDLMEYGLSGADIGKTMNNLLSVVIENPKLNDKATLIALIDNL
ncbi:MAG: CCA tRNA nucleotidyltransferase [Lachnospira sp.]